MDIEEAKLILSDNFNVKGNTLIGIMHEYSRFPKLEFWQAYESIECLAKNKIFSRELAEQVSYCYHNFLKGCLYHFAGGDEYSLDDMPDNFDAYIERLEYIQLYFFRGFDKELDDDMFELERYG